MSNGNSNIGCRKGQKIYTSKGYPIFFLMMRFNIKITLIFVTLIGAVILMLLYSLCNKDYQTDDYPINEKLFNLSGSEGIDCDINGQYIIRCKKEGDEVYVPFSFLHSYYEVYGKLATYDSGLERFIWSHSYGRIAQPKSKYDPRGVYMSFENYNVEIRDRVKCISAIESVPVSTQWESQGYYYATQIAQFGLSHYSKNLTDPEPRRTLFEDGDKTLADWIVPKSAELQRIHSEELSTYIVEYKTSDKYDEGITFNMEHVLDFIMKIDIKLNGNSSLTVVLQNRTTNDLYFLHYITSDILITVQDNNIYHGVGIVPRWRRLTRDLIVDLHKGLNFASKDKSKFKVERSKLKTVSVILRGSGALDNFTLSSSEHIQQFYDAAEWFVKYQDADTGGWLIPVKRKLPSGFLTLEPGWLSAMSQGHAISVLSRAYFHSGGDTRYLNAATNGLKPFRVPSSMGGVLATFMNQYNWYEEYPTKPPSFVLNGFIFSLLGLYDLISIAPKDQAKEAQVLYKEGITTLTRLLPFFDMGSATSYDLRHFTLGVAPNLARWDYHATHINQLLLLYTIENEPLYKTTAERWIGYMNGKRADHN